MRLAFEAANMFAQSNYGNAAITTFNSELDCSIFSIVEHEH